MHEWMKAIRRLMQFLDDNAAQSPSLADIAAQVGYSPYYCSEQFHRISGMTIREYLAKRRLSMAADALRETDISIVEIALNCGFSSQQALTRAFTNAYGCAPYAYRKDPSLCKVVPSLQDLNGVTEMSNLVLPSYRFEYIPSHKYLGIYKRSNTSLGEMWPWHDCDLVTGIVQRMEGCDPIVSNHTAGWTWVSGERQYFYGAGVPNEFAGEIPEGFELRGEFPGSYYIVFSHPPFDYETENEEVMRRVEELAWGFDPTAIGWEWNEDVCQDYQRHYPEGLGYQILRPVKKMK